MVTPQQLSCYAKEKSLQQPISLPLLPVPIVEAIFGEVPEQIFFHFCPANIKFPFENAGRLQSL